MSEQTLKELHSLKENKFLKPYAKLLILLYKFSHTHQYTNQKQEVSLTNVLREILGGNYLALVKDGVLDGLIEYERGKAPQLTLEGLRVARRLVECWDIIRREKEREREKTT